MEGRLHHGKRNKVSEKFALSLPGKATSEKHDIITCENVSPLRMFLNTEKMIIKKESVKCVIYMKLEEFIEKGIDH